jgi:hypothetical protein
MNIRQGFLTMAITVHEHAVSDLGWNTDRPTNYFSQPYSALEAMAWIYRVLISPPRHYLPTEDTIPSGSVANLIVNPIMKLGFVGDIMVIKDIDFVINKDVKSFFYDVDVMIGNFEGIVLTQPRKHVFMAQQHSERVLSILRDFFPPAKTILACANNHSGDYGWSGFKLSRQRIQDFGFTTIGSRDQPAALINEKVNIAACTKWSNQDCNFVATLEESNKYFLEFGAFNILYPHWGYEMQLLPKTPQRLYGEQLINIWDAVIGHHSHCPQPISLFTKGSLKKMMAYSLGNFISTDYIKTLPVGIILKFEIGECLHGGWGVGRIDWELIWINERSKTSLELGLIPDIS